MSGRPSAGVMNAMKTNDDHHDGWRWGHFATVRLISFIFSSDCSREGRQRPRTLRCRPRIRSSCAALVRSSMTRRCERDRITASILQVLLCLLLQDHCVHGARKMRCPAECMYNPTECTYNRSGEGKLRSTSKLTSQHQPLAGRCSSGLGWRPQLSFMSINALAS